MRIGQGFDAHVFGGDTPLVLGGVAIPGAPGLRAYSDGDCLLHALTDALLGALALGDLGTHYPDDDPRYAGVDSRVLLRDAIAMITARGWSVSNADTTLIAQRPRLAGYTQAMAANIAADLALPAGAVGVKATTTERMGFTGRGEGVAALAVVLLAPA